MGSIVSAMMQDEGTTRESRPDPIGILLEKYESGEIGTASDLANEAEELAAETGNDALLDAVRKFRDFQREDWELAGRADWDEAESALISGIERARIT